MSIVSSRLNSDIEIDTRVRERYRQTINDLHGQGFTFFCSYSETLFPFSLFFLSPVYIAMRSYSEVTRIVTPLRVVTYYPLLRHTETGTLALLNGLNTKFHTLFTDGTVLISANSQTKLINSDKDHIYKSFFPGTVSEAWKKHQEWQNSFSAKGLQRRQPLTFDDYVQISDREEKFTSKETVGVILYWSLLLLLVVWGLAKVFIRLIGLLH